MAWHRATDLGRSWLQLPDWVPLKCLGVSCTQIRAAGNKPSSCGLPTPLPSSFRTGRGRELGWFCSEVRTAVVSSQPLPPEGHLSFSCGAG